ncbi:MAG: 50S ribosomal protein L21 [Deltaproteobacteria bacterium]|nr:50S ribosomal protein L21 [Deltaproteobacteria bacterium]
MKYAIIETGGKQYKVTEGEKLKIEKIPEGVIGQTIEFTRVLMVGGDNPVIGTPVVDSAKVAGEIVTVDQDKKVMVFKKKRRKGYSKHFGHRQEFTEVLIKQISA